METIDHSLDYAKSSRFMQLKVKKERKKTIGLYSAEHKMQNHTKTFHSRSLKMRTFDSRHFNLISIWGSELHPSLADRRIQLMIIIANNH